MSAKTYKARGVDGSESYRHKKPQEPVICVQPGDRVQLDWWGDSGVPQWLHKSWATVVRCNRKRIVVAPDRAVPGYEIAVLPERHVMAVRYIP